MLGRASSLPHQLRIVCDASRHPFQRIFVLVSAYPSSRGLGAARLEIAARAILGHIVEAASANRSLARQDSAVRTGVLIVHPVVSKVRAIKLIAFPTIVDGSLDWNTGVDAAGDYVTPISTTYRGRTIYECPPNGQGVVALLILNILSRFSLSNDPFNADDLHRLLEATRLAYAARDAMVADPSRSDGAVERMLSSALADRLAGGISLKRVIEPLPSFDTVEHKDTIYLCVVDRDRNAVSFINSIFSSYGSGLMAPRSGVLFHNRGQSFSLAAGHPNEIGPRKRPMHTIIPGMVAEGGRVVMPFGVMGGHYQAMGHAHLLSRLYDCGLDLQTAIDLPRLFPLPGTATVEAEEASAPASAPNWNAAASMFSRPAGPSVARRPSGSNGSAAF